MTDVIQSNKSDTQRIADRLKPSNDTRTADTIATHGTGPTRVVHSVHRSGHQHQHGQANSGEDGITGHKRTQI
jgi:hypothetical protein